MVGGGNDVYTHYDDDNNIRNYATADWKVRLVELEWYFFQLYSTNL